ncbi:hypothetical protein O181_030777 [Austropuccinia psidii MF-1]|uniref:TPR-like protein n=1 Tax=Austropuccinia psidii MF-1 TaxID=1389203 RepID=A0A9Q3CWD7_9BASI|nr:hypothetical protein [Austropuccinia psidii MF-1]
MLKSLILKNLNFCKPSKFISSFHNLNKFKFSKYQKFNNSKLPFSTSIYRNATLTNSPPSSVEPIEQESQRLIEKGSSLLEKGDLEGALKTYQSSLLMKPSPNGYYNLGIVLYQLKRIPEAIEAWEKSLAECPSADVHTNLASAYILSKQPQPFKALDHLKKAVELDPTDGEIRFNLGAVNEANGHLNDALAEYNKARQLGVKRAEQNIRNVGAKLLRKRLTEEKNMTPKKDEQN